MRLIFQFLIALLLLLIVIYYFIFNIFTRDIKPSSQVITEETLVDSANLLAQFAAQDFNAIKAGSGLFETAFQNLNPLPISAKIHDHIKAKVTSRIYITDKNGIVIFDSNRTQSAIGEDYSRWNDVYLTLRGEYGARSTKANAKDSHSTVMYIAAPIVIDQIIVGSLTVAKPTRDMLNLVSNNERQIKIAGTLLLLMIIFIGVTFIARLNHQLKRLEHYARNVAAGKNVRMPQMSGPEFSLLASSLEEMRKTLEGKSYIEHYANTLTHELKSPLAAIRGASEILAENPPDAIRQQFSENIHSQTERMQQLIDRLLYQVQIENVQTINPTQFDLIELIETILITKRDAFMNRKISLQSSYNALTKAPFIGDAFMLEQALSNLLDNAYDFSPDGANICVELKSDSDNYSLSVIDEGVGIPDYAKSHLFDRFYSLARPQREKSTGLGLSFVKEVMLLHQGEVTLTNRDSEGAIAILILPLYLDY